MRVLLLISLGLSMLLSCKQDKVGVTPTDKAQTDKAVVVAATVTDRPLVESAQVLDTLNAVDTILSDDQDEADTVTEKSTIMQIDVSDAKKSVFSKPIKKKAAKKGILTFEAMVFDFGEIEEGDIVNHDFVFVNDGMTPINILNAEVTCGCTFPSIPFIATAPGANGKIGVQYNSVNKFGPQEATITLFSDAKNKEVQLKVKGFVKGEEKELKLYDPRDAITPSRDTTEDFH